MNARVRRRLALWAWLHADDETPREVSAMACSAARTRLLAGIARVLGRDEDAVDDEDLFQEIHQAFVLAFVAEDGRVRGEPPTTYLQALVPDPFS